MDRLASHAIPDIAAEAPSIADDVFHGPILRHDRWRLALGGPDSKLPQASFPNTAARETNYLRPGRSAACRRQSKARRSFSTSARPSSDRRARFTDAPVSLFSIFICRFSHPARGTLLNTGPAERAYGWIAAQRISTCSRSSRGYFWVVSQFDSEG
jgi:hypothetical protein